MSKAEAPLLVVEDNDEIRALLRAGLQREGWKVLAAAGLGEAMALVGNARPCLVVLDLGLPDGEGIEFIHRVRRTSSVPVIVLSARDDERTKVQALDAGADDYLTKPFGMAELAARVRVALRHAARQAPAGTVYFSGRLRVDFARRLVQCEGREVHLTPTEFSLLERLARTPGRVATHRQLLSDVWGPEYVEHTHYLRIYMGQLRAKLEEDSAQPRYLLTEPGIGYRLAEAQDGENRN